MTIKWKLQPANTIVLVHAAFIWIGLFAAEVGAGFVLRHKGGTENYHTIAVGLASLLCILVTFLGKRPVVHDIQEICLYDVFLQLFGLYLYKTKASPDIYLTAAQLMAIWKGLRVTWPIYCKSLQLPTNWPPFGVIGILRAWRYGMAGAGFSGTVTLRTYMVIIGLPVTLFFVQQLEFIAPLPMQSLLTLLIVFGGTWPLIASLEKHEEERLQTARDLGIAEGEAAAKAKSVAELTAKNAKIEQQALALAAQNTQLEALSAEREAMIQELAKRNATLRDASHDFKVPLLSLSGLVHQLQDQVTVAAPAQLLTRLDQGLEELRSMMGDIIQQAKISTELTTPIARRLEVMELSNFFHERFHEMAAKRDVSFAVRADEFAVFANEMLLRRAITNLANNAILYAEPGTQVTLSFRRSGARCYVRIYDTGPGIANANGPDRHANFVNLIDTIKQRRQPITPDAATAQGHGLGLQIVQRLCQELGSEIGLQSLLGFGTVFRFSIPLAD